MDFSIISTAATSRRRSDTLLFVEAPFTRRHFLAAASAASLPAARKPNIVLILLDDLGYADVGCYGQKKIQTPNIDKLAAQGVRFTDCYAGAAVCAPSRSVLMTGKHAGHAPVRANAGTIPLFPDDVTVAEVLRSAGYKTGLFGKWGLGDGRSESTPLKQGFDEAFGYYHQTHAHTYYPDFLWKNDATVPVEKGKYSADLIAEATFDFVRRHKDHPFFVYAAWTLPHGRYEPPSSAPYEDRDWPEVERNYASMVTRADRHIGTLLETLEKSGIAGDTAVFFTSDNGGTGGEIHKLKFFDSNGPLRAQKGTVYEGGIRVPMIVRWPGRTKAGAVRNEPWGFFDVLPTFAEIAGAKAPEGIDGVSMIPEITGKSRSLDRTLYWEHVTYEAKSGKLREDRMLQAARRGRWKAVKNGQDGAVELYDLSGDIGESRDLAASQPKMQAEFAEFLRKSHAPPRPHNTGTMGTWQK